MGVPYTLHCRMDSGEGPITIVLLHGIASTGSVWQHIGKYFQGQPVRVIELDLLGFGGSPKPTARWVKYNVEDHAKAIIWTLTKLGVDASDQVRLVGHSMGGLVAIGVATLRPKLVDELILYEPPFYLGIPADSPFTHRLKTYLKLYNAMIGRGGSFIRRASVPLNTIAPLTGFTLKKDNWVPFQRSMYHIVLGFDAIAALKALQTPTKILYGRYDSFVFDDAANTFFGHKAKHVAVTELPTTHILTPHASKVLAEEILKK
ncbi:MAG TPA: alpha/beta hydrolase [Candidatus Saccharimonadales bacterium]|nr:alpha/beta hydrolase [Candidatus Saccharimonadales bacterium]